MILHEHGFQAEKEKETYLLPFFTVTDPRKTGKDTVLADQDRWFVYILRCADGTLYTGITKDIDRRLDQHNAGTASRYTRCRLPVRLEYQENQSGQSPALKRELAIKKLTRRQKEALFQ